MRNLFNQVAGKMVSSLGGHGSASAGVLQAVVGMIGRERGWLAGIVKLFQDKGLGETVKSWAGNGARQSISADQVQEVFGTDRISALGEEAGLTPRGALGTGGKAALI